jgi:uncharacterized membrane protein (DUF2068 family)
MAAVHSSEPWQQRSTSSNSNPAISGAPGNTAKLHPRGGHLLRLIAVFKFLKSASLIALSVGLFRTIHGNLGERLEHWVSALRLDPGNRHVEAFLMRAANLDSTQIKKIGLVGLLYAGLFLLEGTGLWLQRRWGEWVTVVITGLLVPVEAYEIYKHPSGAKVSVLVFNVAVVWYLIYRIRTEDRQ